MLYPWSTVSFPQLKRMSSILTLFLSTCQRLFTGWSSITIKWTKGCHWFTSNFTFTRWEWWTGVFCFWLHSDFILLLLYMVNSPMSFCCLFIYYHNYVIYFWSYKRSLLLCLIFISFNLSWHEALFLMCLQICRALAYIHTTIGVCHRDIKPQNLLVWYL